MCLKNADLNISTERECYLTHSDRSDDTDDVLLDAANQLDLTRRDLLKWAMSRKSYNFMKGLDNPSEVEVEDFINEFESLYHI